ncbi:hypothetical protein CP083_05820 [Candidatus Bathyarchaeota archaeon B24-2]|nr:MAG: hypothetical protein CP083_05820 [Candidatus Bathyarchaeota archaeon B24-2]
MFTHAKVEPTDPAIEAITNFDMKTLHERASCNKEAAVSIHGLTLLSRRVVQYESVGSLLRHTLPSKIESVLKRRFI